jgi:hypothetical protein
MQHTLKRKGPKHVTFKKARRNTHKKLIILYKYMNTTKNKNNSEPRKTPYTIHDKKTEFYIVMTREFLKI